MPGRVSPPHDRCGPRCTSPGAGRFQPTWARPWRHASSLMRDTVAVSPVIATVLILAISTIGIGAVMSWGLPSIQQTQALTEVEGVLSQFHAFDQVAESVLHGGAVGKASQSSINFPVGEVQRKVDSLFLIMWFPDRPGGNTDRYDVVGLDDADPDTIEIIAHAGVSPAQHIVYVGRVNDDETWHTVSTGGPDSGLPFGGTDRVSVDLANVYLHDPIPHDAMPTQITVTDTATDERVMEAWLFPVGTLRYTRPTSFGTVAIRLENSCVITEYETGDFIRNRPLAVVDRGTNGDISFAALFQQMLVDNSTFPGVQAAGAGSFPILWTLQNNHLRGPGEDARAVHVDVIGDLGDLWEQHYISTYGFVRHPGESYIRIDAGNDAFEFVLMENRIEVTMKPETTYLGRGE